jgi:hypothetical protein
MNRKTYFDRAAECRQLASNMSGDEKHKILKIAEVWLELANNAVARGADISVEEQPQAKPVTAPLP